MSRFDRREKQALDESYRYYRSLDKNGGTPDLYRLVKCFKAVSAALKFADDGHFKLTLQLWRRMHQALFDKMITSFPGYVIVMSEDGKNVPPRAEFPEEGTIEFHPEGCRRADDVFQMEIKHLYPGTQYQLVAAWKGKGARVEPRDFSGPMCSSAGCFVKPVLLGQEVLSAESETGKNQAYHEWWELYWQAYCTKDRQEQHLLYRRMDELESVWGNLYY